MAGGKARTCRGETTRLNKLQCAEALTHCEYILASEALASDQVAQRGGSVVQSALAGSGQSIELFLIRAVLAGAGPDKERGVGATSRENGRISVFYAVESRARKRAITARRLLGLLGGSGSVN